MIGLFLFKIATDYEDFWQKQAQCTNFFVYLHRYSPLTLMPIEVGGVMGLDTT